MKKLLASTALLMAFAGAASAQSSVTLYGVVDVALERAMHEVRALGFQVGLHTAGLYPQRLAKVLPLVDWVALDIKTEFEDYKAVTSVLWCFSRRIVVASAA